VFACRSGVSSLRESSLAVTDSFQMTERNVCTWLERGKSTHPDHANVADESVMVISDTLSMRTINSNFFPSINPEIPKEDWPSFQDVALT
jgi:hypothetical protein